MHMDAKAQILLRVFLSLSVYVYVCVCMRVCVLGPLFFLPVPFIVLQSLAEVTWHNMIRVSGTQSEPPAFNNSVALLIYCRRAVV